MSSLLGYSAWLMGFPKSLPRREDVYKASKEGADQAEELSAVALLNWEDQILWGLE